MKLDDQNKAFYWASIFLRELHACGVCHLVVSPGSRSTPLTMAAAVHPGFRTDVVLDERSAAYLALGIAKQSGKPAALICTSGTAAANYFPAVTEARHAGVPMILLTADRPPNLRNVGASQAIDQIKLYGNYPVFFHEAGEPAFESAELNRLRSAAAQAFQSAVKRKGPAHINFAFKKPLEPSTNFVKKVQQENLELNEKPKLPRTQCLDLQGARQLPEELKTLLERAKHPVIMEGPKGSNLSGRLAQQLAEKLNAPLLSEFPDRSSIYRLGGFDGFLKNDHQRKLLSPDLIIRFGMQPVSKALQLYLQQYSDVPHIHFSELEEWQDATHSVTHRLQIDRAELEWNLGTSSAENGWLERWRDIEQQFNRHKQQELERTEKLTDGDVFTTLGGDIPPDWNLFLSNSFPIRDWMLFSGSAPHNTFVNRGASGIDGVISTAIGATIGSQKPGVLFIGDLASLHDSNALLSSRLLKEPLILVMLNNRGGNIFRMLPIYEHKPQYRDFFETPQQANFEYMARMHGLPYRSILTRKELEVLSLAEISKPGIHLVECKTDPDASMELRHKLWDFRYG